MRQDDKETIYSGAVAAHSGDRIDFLDHVRGIAILLIFVFHGLSATFGFDQLPWNGWRRSFEAPVSHLVLLPASFGQIGVAIFFVVSGFCIHLSYQRSGRKGYREFFWRRFFRIYPVYVAALVLFAVVNPSTRLGFGTAEGWLQFLSHLLLVHNFLDYRYFLGINGVFWSIAVEVQLYAIYPVLMWIVRRRGWSAALWVTGAFELSLRGICAIYDVQPTAPWTWLFRLPFSFWFSWTLGALLADDMLHKRPVFLARCPLYIWPVLTVAGWFVKPMYVFMFPLAALATANVIAYFLTHSEARLSLPHFLSEQVRLAGIMSYSIYLLHQPFLELVSPLLKDYLPGIQFPALVVYGVCMLSWQPILVPCWLLYRFGELPSIEYGRRFVKRLRATGGNPTLASAKLSHS